MRSICLHLMLCVSKLILLFTTCIQLLHPQTNCIVLLRHLQNNAWNKPLSLLYSSWDVGNAHFVIFSTEVYFYTEYGVELIGEQYNWLEQDLKVFINYK